MRHAFGSARQPDVLVMAGGADSRLGELTAETPRPMLPVNGRPILQHTLEQLRAQGVTHVYLSVQHLSEAIRDHFGDGRWLGLELEYVPEQVPLNTAGAIGLLPRLRRPLLVVNADVLVRLPVDAMVRHHARWGADVTLGSVEHRVEIPFGVIGGRGDTWPDVARLHEKPDVVLRVLAGVYLLSPRVVRTVPPGIALSMPELIEQVMLTGRVVDFDLPGPWLDIGSPASYARADEVATQLAIGSELGVAL